MKGMKVNARKTKVIVFERNQEITECNVMIKGKRVEQVAEFVYLGSLFTRNEKYDGDIEMRVTAANCVNGALYSFMSGQSVLKRQDWRFITAW